MKLPNDYDSAPTFGASEQLPVGAYVCKIRGARVDETNYGDRLAIAFDIVEGDFASYFSRKFDTRKKFSADAKWPGTLNIGILYDGKTSSRFKGFITSVEDSNKGYDFKRAGCEESTLVGKLVGIMFGEEEFVPQNDPDKIATCVKARWACSVDAARSGSLKPPKLKELPPEKRPKPVPFDDLEEVDDDELPF